MISRKNNGGCHKANSRGFTMFEFAVSAVIFAILMAILVNRLGVYQEEADRAKAEQLVGTMRAALQFKVGELIVTSRQASAVKFLDENPIDWLMEKPDNYLGEYYAPPPGTLPKGNWYFDRTSKTLVYLLNNGKSFVEGQSNLLKFKVKFSELNGNSAMPSGQPAAIKGVVLEQVTEPDRGNK
jgi:prepilin-type N-terminal cleavage/methylation domain-containing protein